MDEMLTKFRGQNVYTISVLFKDVVTRDGVMLVQLLLLPPNISTLSNEFSE